METTTKNTVKINGKDVPYDFQGKHEIHLNPFSYGVFDIIGKKTDDGSEEVLYKNAAVSFINPTGEDDNGIQILAKTDGNEPYVVDCATYKKICTMKNLIELKRLID